MRKRFFDLAFTPAVQAQQTPRGSRATGRNLEHLIVVTIEAFDRNCPQHIMPRVAVAELERVLAPMHARMAELEQQLDAARKVITPCGLVPQGPRTEANA